MDETIQAHSIHEIQRELINTMHHYLTLEKLDFLDTSLIDDSQTEPPVPVEVRETNEPLDATMRRLEKLYLIKVLDYNNWQQGKVSALLRVDPKTLYRKIKQYHLKPSYSKESTLTGRPPFVFFKQNPYNAIKIGVKFNSSKEE